MLLELHAAGLGVIDDMSIEFEPGLNVITGETGAGKSMIIGSLSLLLGARADSDALRPGTDEAQVEARFVAPDDVAARLEASGIRDASEIVVVRRMRRGGSRTWVNGGMVTVGQLAEIGADLVELVGQHHARSLTRPSAQRESLDRFAGARVEKARRHVEDLWDRHTELAHELATLGQDPAARAREEEALRRQIAEIHAVAPQPDDDRLADDLRRLQNAGLLRDEVQAAREAVTAARDLVAGAADGLERAGDPALTDAARTLAGSSLEIEAAGDDLRVYLESIVDDPERLEAVRKRHVEVRNLRRQYGPDIVDVVRYATEAEDRLAALARANERAGEIEGALEEVSSELVAAAGVLSQERRRAAGRLTRGVTARLGELALAGAALEVELRPLPRAARHGTDDVAFLYAASPAAPSRPLGKVASGGELSRIVLALAAEIADLDAPPTIVFDEVDAGTGGAAASAVGAALAAQAVRHQLVCVTHLAQVAAHADNHIVVRKEGATATAQTVVETARIVELSRMLSGSPDSTRAQEHAHELIERARAAKRD